jgi:catechol 2,3-dioxygenase-like lactoylglutathione lyase family enzyme
MAVYPKVHLSITVSDLARSIDFYQRFFGEDPVKVKPGYAKFLPSFAPLNLALEARQVKPFSPGRVSHMGIQVADRETVLAHLERVKAAGLPVNEEMNVNCCYANQDKFWVEDPDGTEWEVYVLNRDIEGRGDPKTMCCEEGAPDNALREQAASETKTACCEPACCGQSAG